MQHPAAASEVGGGIAFAGDGREATRRNWARRWSKALRKIGYTNAGTVEFLMDEDGAIYFIEMNARIQVEHPVTELVTGVDLIKAQIRIAAGEQLRGCHRGRCIFGARIECRINAEDPETFVPSAGRITTFQVPGGTGVRVDTAAYADAVIPPYYDSHDRQAHCEGPRPRGGHRAHEAGAGDVRDRGDSRRRFRCTGSILADPDFAAGRFRYALSSSDCCGEREVSARIAPKC